jgi:glutathione S-transferase
MRSPIVMKLEAARLGKCYEALAARLEGREYVLDGGFSAADISLAQALYMSKHFRALAAYPVLAAWYDHVTARAGFAASLPPEGAVRLYQQDFYPVMEQI